MVPIKNAFLFSIIIVSVISCKHATKDSHTDIIESRQAELIWQDEFENDNLPDTTKWSYDVGDTCDRPMGCGWGNRELQYYTASNPRNARVEDGNLVIEAHNEDVDNSDYSSYTSARLVSKNKGDFKYGRIEVRAKMPSGKGTWSAIWMLPTSNKYGGWPKSGEIDIMEHVGYASDTIYGAPHTGDFNHVIGTQKGGEMYLPDATQAFHVYTIEWTENDIKWFVDDKMYHSFDKVDGDPDKWPFDNEFHIILNLAIGGNWGGKHGVDDSSFPNQFIIDYVRVYGLN